jgi:hypothetical protein
MYTVYFIIFFEVNIFLSVFELIFDLGCGFEYIVYSLEGLVDFKLELVLVPV